MTSGQLQKLFPQRDHGYITEGRVLGVENGLACIALRGGESCRARLPEHVDTAFLKSAASIAPVDAALAIMPSGTALVWAIYPGPEHAEAKRELKLEGRRVAIEASESFEVECGESRVRMLASGRVTVRGQHVTSRASGVNRILGGAVRVN